VDEFFGGQRLTNLNCLLC